MPEYLRHLRLPAYTRLLGRERCERYLEPAYYELAELRLRDLEKAQTPRERVLVLARFHWDMLLLMFAAIPLASPGGSSRPRWSPRDLLPSWLDFRHGARTLRRNMRLAGLVVAVLALGIGANTAVFSAFRAVLLRPLPYPEAGRLVHIWATWPGGSGNISYPDYRAILERTRSFESVAAYEAWGNVALTGSGRVIPIVPNFVTASYLPLLGARPLLGRVFSDDDDRAPSGSSVVVLSHAFWQRQFGGDPGVVGTPLSLNGHLFSIIGVVAAGFPDLALFGGPEPDIWLPSATAQALLGQPGLTDVYRVYWSLARLAPGATLEQARAELTAAAEHMTALRPESHRGYTLQGQTLTERLRGSFARPTMLLAVGAAFLLLIACANVSNLLLLRAADRQRDLAVRRALGASEGRLLRELLAEGLLLAVVGGGLGILLATLGIRALRGWIQAHVSSFVDLTVDAPTLAVTLIVSLGTALLFVLAPAHAAREGGQRVDVGSRRVTSDRRGGNWRRALVAVEIGACVVLLAGAGLMVRSILTLTTGGLGFPTRDLVTLRIDLSGERYATAEARVRFTDALVAEAAASPDIASTTLWGPSLLGSATWVLNLIAAERFPAEPPAYRQVARHSINPGGLANLGIPLLAGREFTPQDVEGSPIVAIISESVAREFWPGGDAIGKQLRRANPTFPPLTVVGVAGDAFHRQRYSLTDVAEGFELAGLGPQRDVYQPYAQRANPNLTLAVRARSAPALAHAAIERIVASLDPDLALADVRTLDERLADQQVAPVAISTLLSAYALLALVLTAFGLYGVLSHSVARRTREIGIRLALGARGFAIRRMVFLEGLRMTLAGAIAGSIVALLVTRLMSSLLYGVSPADPWTFVGVVLGIVGTAGLVMQAPLHRAMRVDPVVALRSD